MDPKSIQEQLPLTEVTYFILLSLAPGSKHGYAIMKDVQHMSRKRVTLSTGTLYGALPRMVEQGWIERVEKPRQQRTARVRKLYQLTTTGQAVLEAELNRLDSLVVAAQGRIIGERNS